MHIRHSNDKACAAEMGATYPSIMLYKEFETPTKLVEYTED